MVIGLGSRGAIGVNEQLFGADEQVRGQGSERRTRPVKATGEDGRGRAGHSIKQLQRRDFAGANSKAASR